MSGLKVGDEAPDVTLPNEDGTSVQLSTLWLDKGPVVVFFYPEDHSYGCTKEVCRFRDGYDDFLSVGAAALVGISKGDQESHTSFRQKQKLQFSLLTDKDGEAQKAFKVKKQLFGLIPGRVTFVVDKEGKIAHVFSSALDFGGHVDKAKDVVKRLTASQPSKTTTPAAPAPTAAPAAGSEAAPVSAGNEAAAAPAAVATDASAAETEAEAPAPAPTTTA